MQYAFIWLNSLTSWRQGLEARKRLLSFPCLGLPWCHHSQLHHPSQQNSIAVDPYHPLCRTPMASEEGLCSVLFLPNDVSQVRPSLPILWWLPVDWRAETADHKEHCHERPGFGYWGKSDRICYWGWLSSISECPMVDFNSLLSFLGEFANHVWAILWTVCL